MFCVADSLRESHEGNLVRMTYILCIIVCVCSVDVTMTLYK